MKNIIGLIFALAIFTTSYGQTVNIKGGVSKSILKWEVGEYDFTENTKPLIGFAFYMGMDYFERDYFFMSSDWGYIRKGTDGVGEYVNEEGLLVDEIDDQIKIDYLSFNTMFYLKVPIKKKLIPYVGIGPRLDYFVRYEYRDKSENDLVNNVNFGLNLGGGIKYAFSKIHVGISSHYFVNFNKVADWPSSPSKSGGSAEDTTSIFLLTLGYSIEQK